MFHYVGYRTEKEYKHFVETLNFSSKERYSNRGSFLRFTAADDPVPNVPLYFSLLYVSRMNLHLFLHLSSVKVKHLFYFRYLATRKLLMLFCLLICKILVPVSLPSLNESICKQKSMSFGKIAIFQLCQSN